MCHLVRFETNILDGDVYVRALSKHKDVGVPVDLNRQPNLEFWQPLLQKLDSSDVEDAGDGENGEDGSFVGQQLFGASGAAESAFAGGGGGAGGDIFDSLGLNTGGGEGGGGGDMFD